MHCAKYLFEITNAIFSLFRPSESKLERYRKIKIKEKMTGLIVKDIATYLCFLGIVTVLAYSEKDVNAYWFRKDLQNMFVESTYSKSMRLDDVSQARI